MGKVNQGDELVGGMQNGFEKNIGGNKRLFDLSL